VKNIVDLFDEKYILDIEGVEKLVESELFDERVPLFLNFLEETSGLFCSKEEKKNEQ
jgi:hypothetical protein